MNHLNNMEKLNFFSTFIWHEQNLNFVESLNKASNKHIKEAKNYEKNKKYRKKYGDFGISYHSKNLVEEQDFIEFRNYVANKSVEYLYDQGVKTDRYNYLMTELWVQEFGKKAGNHSSHIHSNQHVSGFYFLKCGPETSYPIFYDPRNGAMTTKLDLREHSRDEIFNDDSVINFKPQPGSLIIFPGYLRHEFVLDHGIKPFRFIHFNVQAVPSEVFK